MRRFRSIEKGEITHEVQFIGYFVNFKRLVYRTFNFVIRDGYSYGSRTRLQLYGYITVDNLCFPEYFIILTERRDRSEITRPEGEGLLYESRHAARWAERERAFTQPNGLR